MKQGFFYETALGQICFVSEDGFLTNLFFGKMPGEIRVKEDQVIWEAYRQLMEYFALKRTGFTIPIQYGGTEFQRRVWEALLCIPYGETRTYRDIARLAGNEKAVRAVGMANHHNPIAIIIPCHRVVGEKGTLVGYNGGIEKKRTLLGLEGFLFSRKTPQG